MGPIALDIERGSTMTLTASAYTIAPPDMTAVGMPLYANTSNVTFTPFDFRLSLSLLTMPHDQGSLPDRGAIVLTPKGVAEIVIPAGAVGQFADVLRAELGLYVERFGEPRRGY
jgi:hypothetical protein